MIQRIVGTLSGSLLVLGLASCQRLTEGGPFTVDDRGQFEIGSTAFADAIPADYGDLIGVTARPDRPEWTQAWFMRPDKSIVVVWINASVGKVSTRVVSIPRR